MDYVATKALLQAKHGKVGDMSFCEELGAIYYWRDFASSAPTADNSSCLITGNGSDTRWIKSNIAVNFKNKIINGNFDKWDYNTTQNSSGYGSDNRWANWHIGGSKTHERGVFAIGQTDVPNNPDYYSKTTRVHAVGASNYCMKQQRIENVKESNGLKYTIGFLFKSDVARDIAVDFTQNFGSGGSADVHTAGNVTKIAVTTSWEFYTVTVDFPSIAGKTIGDDNYYSVNFWYEAGSDFDSRTSSLGHQSGDFELAQVQFEEGAMNTEFEVLPLSIIDTLCGRFLQKSYESNTPVSTATLIGGIIEPAIRNIAGLTIGFQFRQEMRGVPNIVTYSTTTGASGMIENAGDKASTIYSPSSTGVRFFGIAGGTTFDANYHYTAEAEL